MPKKSKPKSPAVVITKTTKKKVVSNEEAEPLSEFNKRLKKALEYKEAMNS